ncbi:PAS and ANTAR domain-containing protein [Mycobacterium kubicae]|uniref:PAS and ANTAR domain-containing protein n=1 Tax=Mycobacterium kubicae TaxID=120959 RepID=UPI0008019302|nr:PAS and ANTAR domain-containing protein [Mycobacterium kubicae]OBK55717.1 hypothetical protein A5657_10565 [Mycobacterium kubicae]
MRDSTVGQRWPDVGRFRHLLGDDRWEWSDEVALMHGYQPGSVTPTTDLLLSHAHPDDIRVLSELIERVRRDQTAFSCRHRLIDTQGEVHEVLVVCSPLQDDRGAWAGTEGCYVDLTEEFEADVQERVTQTVLAVSARRAVINQAMGIVMMRYGVDAQAAFGLLTRLSQSSNIKLRFLAEQIVDDRMARQALLTDAVHPGGRPLSVHSRR